MTLFDQMSKERNVTDNVVMIYCWDMSKQCNLSGEKKWHNGKNIVILIYILGTMSSHIRSIYLLFSYIINVFTPFCL